MITKFLKADGTIDEGEPLTDQQAYLRASLADYLHAVVCNYAYHATWEGQPKCQAAASWLTFILTTIQVDEFGDCIAEKVKRMEVAKQPAPRPQAWDDEKLPEAKPVADDDLPL
jgi:hypothetical protein